MVSSLLNNDIVTNPIYWIGTIIAILIGAAIYSSLKPKKKSKVDTKLFDSLVDDGDWAADEDDKKVPPQSAFTSGFLNKSMANTTTKKKVNKGPYSIGDRVILKNLVSAKELNGRHGVIGDLWDEKTERYPIDLDLIDNSRKNTSDTNKNSNSSINKLSVKVGNLEKEPEIAEPTQKRALVSNACLEESQGRACAFIFKTVRGVVTSILNGPPKPNGNGNNPMAGDMFLPWKYWDEIPQHLNKTNNKETKGLYEPVVEFLTRGILLKAKLQDLEKNLNPVNPKGAYAVVTDAVKSELAVKSWNVRIEGQFWMMNVTPEGTLVISVANPRQVYCVAGFQKPLGALGNFPRPPKVQLTLLPWYGRIIHDPMLSSTTGTNQMELATPSMTQMLLSSIRTAAQENRIISRLAQLEVPGGSRGGVPFVQPVFTPPPPNATTDNNSNKPDFSNQSPATEKERAAVENLSEFDPILPQPQLPQQQQNPMQVWNFIRQDLINSVSKKSSEEEKEDTKKTEETNVIVVLDARGQQLHQIKLAKKVPEALEILKGALMICTKAGNRPLMFGVDDPNVANRLQFLLQGFKGMRIMLLKVQGKK